MIKYVNGDATLPIGDGVKLIIHIVNDSGVFGAGFAKAIKNRYPLAREQYIQWSQNGIDQDVIFWTGKTQFVKVREDIHVANMIAQHGTISAINHTPIHYDALISCLKDVTKFALNNNASIHLPKIGAGLAGGDWRIIEQIINKELCDNGLFPTVYVL